MAKLTPKENYLRVGRGEIPEWVPGGAMSMPYKDHGISAIMAGPFQILIGQSEMITGWTQPQGDWQDMWGANFTWEPRTRAGLPKPNAFILDDISNWEKVIKHPPEPRGDWEAMAKADLDKVDRSQAAVVCTPGIQPFQQLVAFMGFENTLIALVEDPGACVDLLNYLIDWYVPRIQTILDYWKPDVMSMGDDTATSANPFFSLEIYRSIFKPIYARLAKPVKERGVLIDFHNCGRSEDFVGDMIDFGVNYWNPCQKSNDLVAVQKKYGNKIALTGGWEHYPLKTTDSEETVRGYVRDYLDKYAKNGSFLTSAMAGDFLNGPEGMAQWEHINAWINDEVYEYGTAIYKSRF